MSDKKGKSDFDDTMESITKNLGRAAKIAGIAGRAIGRQVQKTGVAKTIEDGGREVVRAGTNVATRFGEGLQRLGTRLDETFASSSRPSADPHGEQKMSNDKSASDKPYPKTRDEFEKKYGKVDGDWPRTPEEFEKRFGFPPGDKPVGPTPRDPGFRIM